MLGKKVLFGLSALASLLLMVGCGSQKSADSSTAIDTNRQVFQVKGLLKELKPNGKTAVIAHETIPDYMDAMTMDFDVKDKRELEGLRPGDALSFRMVVTKDDGWIENVRKLPPATPTNASQIISITDTNGTNVGPLTFRRSPIVEPLNIGDAVPDYKFTNQFGGPISLGQFKGRALAVTFIFTRCPFPTFCPRMSQYFEKAQKQLKSQTDAPKNWSFLSVTIDPAFDTPPRLRAYTAQYNLDTNHWQFATSDLWTIDGITEQVGFTFYRPTPTALPEHNLRTIVIDASGRLQKIFVGNEWTTDEFVSEMVKASEVK
ncbi:MAG TPA: SCO family protein [Candidatus Limnocylindria bacterium]|nr:SCO family protein [Candidatus Limnocylindria bacterium]